LRTLRKIFRSDPVSIVQTFQNVGKFTLASTVTTALCWHTFLKKEGHHLDNRSVFTYFHNKSVSGPLDEQSKQQVYISISCGPLCIEIKVQPNLSKTGKLGAKRRGRCREAAIMGRLAGCYMTPVQHLAPYRLSLMTFYNSNRVNVYTFRRSLFI